MAEIAYIKTNWVNNVTKLNADNMNHIENGIEALDVALNTKASVDYVNKTHYGYSGDDLLIIPEGTTTINDSAYKETNYKCVVIPDSVTSIGKHAFASCSGLKSITIPNSVTHIGVGAFQGSPVTIIDLTAFTTESFPTIDADVFELGVGGVIKVVKGRKNELANLSTNWAKYGDYIVEVDWLGSKSDATNITNGTARNSLVGNDIENNQVISENVSSFGTNNFTGLKGYYWSDINFNAKKIQISKSHTDTTEITCKYQVGDVISIVNKFRYENCSTITAVDINTVTVDSLPFSSIESTTADYSDYVIYCPEKPDIGEVDLGKNVIAFGEENSASNRSVLVAGRQNKASGQYSASLGRLNKSLGYGSVTMGRQCVASADYSMAVGYKSKAIGRFSNAEGYGCVAGGTVSDISQNPGRDKFTTGFYSHAEGYATLSSGLASHSEGLQTTAAGSYSHTEGVSSSVAPNEINTNNYDIIKASWYNKPFSLSLRDGSHAEGHNTLALAKYSHAQNECCIAQNIGSHAGGNHTVTSRAYQTAIGEYNADNTSALLIVGNGSDTKRSNALELDKDGNTKIAGSLTLNMNSTPVTITASQLTKLLVGDKYELIEEIDITEDTNSITREIEPNGTAYNFKKLVVVTTSPKGTFDPFTMYCKFYSGNQYVQGYTQHSSNETYYKRALYQCYLDGNRMVFENTEQGLVYGTQSSSGGDSISLKKSLDVTIADYNITKIVMSVSNSNVIASGYLIQIYGVRA